MSSITELVESILGWFVNVATSKLPDVWHLAPVQFGSWLRTYLNALSYFAAFCTFVVCTVMYIHKGMVNADMSYRLGYRKQAILYLLVIALCTEVLWPALLMTCYFLSSDFYPYITCTAVAVLSYFLVEKAGAAAVQEQLPFEMRMMRGPTYPCRYGTSSAYERSWLLGEGVEDMPDPRHRLPFRSSMEETCPGCGTSLLADHEEHMKDPRHRPRFQASTPKRGRENKIPENSLDPIELAVTPDEFSYALDSSRLRSTNAASTTVQEQLDTEPTTTSDIREVRTVPTRKPSNSSEKAAHEKVFRKGKAPPKKISRVQDDSIEPEEVSQNMSILSDDLRTTRSGNVYGPKSLFVPPDQYSIEY